MNKTSLQWNQGKSSWIVLLWQFQVDYNNKHGEEEESVGCILSRFKLRCGLSGRLGPFPVNCFVSTCQRCSHPNLLGTQNVWSCFMIFSFFAFCSSGQHDASLLPQTLSVNRLLRRFLILQSRMCCSSHSFVPVGFILWHLPQNLQMNITSQGKDIIICSSHYTKYQGVYLRLAEEETFPYAAWVVCICKKDVRLWLCILRP